MAKVLQRKPKTKTFMKFGDRGSLRPPKAVVKAELPDSPLPPDQAPKRAEKTFMKFGDRGSLRPPKVAVKAELPDSPLPPEGPVLNPLRRKPDSYGKGEKSKHPRTLRRTQEAAGDLSPDIDPAGLRQAASLKKSATDQLEAETDETNRRLGVVRGEGDTKLVDGREVANLSEDQEQQSMRVAMQKASAVKDTGIVKSLRQVPVLDDQGNPMYDEKGTAITRHETSDYDRAKLEQVQPADVLKNITRKDVLKHLRTSRANGESMTYNDAKQQLIDEARGAQQNLADTAAQNAGTKKLEAEARQIDAVARRMDVVTQQVEAAGGDPSKTLSALAASNNPAISQAAIKSMTNRMTSAGVNPAGVEMVKAEMESVTQQMADIQKKYERDLGEVPQMSPKDSARMESLQRRMDVMAIISNGMMGYPNRDSDGNVISMEEALKQVTGGGNSPGKAKGGEGRPDESKGDQGGSTAEGPSAAPAYNPLKKSHPTASDIARTPSLLQKDKPFISPGGKKWYWKYWESDRDDAKYVTEEAYKIYKKARDAQTNSRSN